MHEALPKPTGIYGHINWSHSEECRRKLLKSIYNYVQARRLYFRESCLTDERVLCVPYENEP